MVGKAKFEEYKIFMEMWETADPQNECIFLQMFSARWHLMLVSSCACNETTLCGI